MCVKHNLLLVSDEVYEHLSFQASFARVATLDDSIGARTLTAGSLGKLFNATGWRIGFIIGPANLVEYVQKAHLVVAYASSSPAQKAAAVGLRVAEEKGFWQANLKDVQKKVGKVCDVLRELGIPVGLVAIQSLFFCVVMISHATTDYRKQFVEPAGAYFIFVDISGIKIPTSYPFPEPFASRSQDFQVCYYLTTEIGISSIPGSCGSFSPSFFIYPLYMTARKLQIGIKAHDFFLFN